MSERHIAHIMSVWRTGLPDDLAKLPDDELIYWGGRLKQQAEAKAEILAIPDEYEFYPEGSYDGVTWGMGFTPPDWPREKAVYYIGDDCLLSISDGEIGSYFRLYRGAPSNLELTHYFTEAFDVLLSYRVWAPEGANVHFYKRLNFTDPRTEVHVATYYREQGRIGYLEHMQSKFTLDAALVLDECGEGREAEHATARINFAKLLIATCKE